MVVQWNTTKVCRCGPCTPCDIDNPQFGISHGPFGLFPLNYHQLKNNMSDLDADLYGGK